MNRTTKKLLLFLSDENPIWMRIQKIELQLGTKLHVMAGNHITPAELFPHDSFKQSSRDAKLLDDPKPPTPRHLLLGISGQTLDNWKRGVVGRKQKFDVALDNLNAQLNGLIAGFKLRKELKDFSHCIGEAHALRQMIEEYKSDWLLGDSGMKVYETARLILKIDVAAAQKALDSVFYAQAPLLPRAFYDSKDEANDSFDHVRGYYLGWMNRFGRWMRCSLHVRYVLEIGGKFFIRVKLNLPKLYPGHTEERYWEYDGFVHVERRRCFWFFDKRPSHSRHDYFTLITGLKETILGDERLFSGLIGQYLTTHQEEFQAIVSGTFLLQSIDAEDGLSDQGRIAAQAFMWDRPEVFEEMSEDAQRMRQIFERLKISPETLCRNQPR